MPIGVPRILYSWSEELPPQWTDIYNYIFRRRMIFLMQYLDDDLCNQICGLLINIHMEDRSKDLEKKELEKSNVFKSPMKSSTTSLNSKSNGTSQASSLAANGKGTNKSIQDLLTSEEDLMIDENYQLEQYTLQKITLDWLNWTANYFDYSNEPYLFYLTEILAKDFITDNANLLYNYNSKQFPLSSALEIENNNTLKVPKFLQQNRLIKETSNISSSKSKTLLRTTSFQRKEQESSGGSCAGSTVEFLSGDPNSSLAKLAFNVNNLAFVSPAGVPPKGTKDTSLSSEGSNKGPKKIIRPLRSKEGPPYLLRQGPCPSSGNEVEEGGGSYAALPTGCSAALSKIWMSSELSKFMGIFKAMVDFSLLGKRLKNSTDFVKEVEKVNSGKNSNLFDFWTPPLTSMLSTEAINYFISIEERKPKRTLPPLPVPGEWGRYFASTGTSGISEFNFFPSFVNVEKENPLEKSRVGKKVISIFEKFNSPEVSFSPLRYFAAFNADYYSFSLFKNTLQPANEIKEGIGLNILKQIDRLKKVENTDKTYFSLFNELTNKKYVLKTQTHKKLLESSKQALSQRLLKNQYKKDKTKFFLPKEVANSNMTKFQGNKQNIIIGAPPSSTSLPEEGQGPFPLGGEGKEGIQKRNRFKIKNGKNYLNPPSFSSLITNPLRSDSFSSKNSFPSCAEQGQEGIQSWSYEQGRKPLEKTFSYRKQAEKAIEEEELKKVFVIINSFGGSVGNGITVHDALQFIKAGSLTLALGVAASAASLVLAGGTIGERYVTEGCHTMIHQPEGSINGQASDILIDSNEIMKIRLDVAEIYSLSTYRPRHKILRDLDRDFYLTATETLSYGLADEIATNDVLSEIIDMTNKVWDYHEGQQQRLLESRERASSGLDTQTQN